MFSWYLGILGVLISFSGVIFFFKASFKMKGELKNSILFLVGASAFYAIFSSIMIGLVFNNNTGFNNLTWQSVPILFFVSAIIFVIGSFKLLRLLEKMKKWKLDMLLF